jgi:hypothetical protein
MLREDCAVPPVRAPYDVDHEPRFQDVTDRLGGLDTPVGEENRLTDIEVAACQAVEQHRQQFAHVVVDRFGA